MSVFWDCHKPLYLGNGRETPHKQQRPIATGRKVRAQSYCISGCHVLAVQDRSLFTRRNHSLPGLGPQIANCNLNFQRDSSSRVVDGGKCPNDVNTWYGSKKHFYLPPIKHEQESNTCHQQLRLANKTHTPLQPVTLVEK